MRTILNYLAAALAALAFAALLIWGMGNQAEADAKRHAYEAQIDCNRGVAERCY